MNHVNNLLVDQVFRVLLRTSSPDLCRMSLPCIFAALARDDVDSFPALRPHQHAAWHMFLVQLAALALHRAGVETMPKDTGAWKDMLQALTPEAKLNAWSLVVDDPVSPAFMQPPVPEGTLAGWNKTSTPDALDVLITSKNFDVKTATAHRAEADDWAFALITVQTMEGVLGRGNHRIARMNGGYSARLFLGLAPKDGGFGAHIRFDVERMLGGRARVLEDFDYADNGHALLWLEPWDGGTSLSLKKLDPWFIEICRRVRLEEHQGACRARKKPTKKQRIAAKEINGVTGDFWAPIHSSKNKAVSLGVCGFSAENLSKWLFNADYTLPDAVALSDREGDMHLVCRGIARGEGKTDGLFEKIIPFRRPTLAMLRCNRPDIARVATEQLKEIKEITKALQKACAVVACGGAEDGPKKKEHDAFAKPYCSALDQAAQAGFFACLQDRLAKDDSAKMAYLGELVSVAKKQLDVALKGLPCSALRRERARHVAERAFWGVLWGHKSPLAKDREQIMEQIMEQGHAR